MVYVENVTRVSERIFVVQKPIFMLLKPAFACTTFETRFKRIKDAQTVHAIKFVYLSDIKQVLKYFLFLIIK